MTSSYNPLRCAYGFYGNLDSLKWLDPLVCMTSPAREAMQMWKNLF